MASPAVWLGLPKFGRVGTGFGASTSACWAGCWVGWGCGAGGRGVDCCGGAGCVTGGVGVGGGGAAGVGGAALRIACSCFSIFWSTTGRGGGDLGALVLGRFGFSRRVSC